MNLSQRQLRIFVTTAALGNITRASESLHVSQPALTRALQEFEAALGVALFRRTTRTLSLSPDGERFLPTAQRLLRDMEQATVDLKAGTDGICGTVVLAVGAAFACTVLPPVLARFTRVHPRVRVCVRTGNSIGITSQVARGMADLGIGSPIGDTDALECTPLLRAPLGLLGDPSVFALSAETDIDDAIALPLLKESDDTSVMNILRSGGSRLVGRMHHGTEVSCLATQLALVKAGVGVAVLSAVGASHPEARDLRFSKLRPNMAREVFVLQHRARHANPGADALLQAIVQHLPASALLPSVERLSAGTGHVADA